MAYDSDAGKPPSYGPSWAYFKVNCMFMCVSLGLCSTGLVPFDAAAQLQEEGAPWTAHCPWIGRVVLRNVVMVIAWYGFWHYLLYVRRVCKVEKKFNPDWQIGYLYDRDRALCVVGTVIASFFEAVQVYLWASGSIRYDKQSLLQRPAWNLFWMAANFYWSDVHFWIVHRVMHPWFNPKSSFDIGAHLYRHVHALHHKSFNPGPWSGLAMHPIEHFAYFCRGSVICLLPFALHPVHFVNMQLRAMLGPATSHHGFDGYLGFKFHYLHHAKFEVNFGTSCVVPIDNIMGTFSTGGIKDRTEADRSLKAWMWVLWLPYLVPLAVLANVCS